ncbi:hypothetical protein RB601_002508 [Gaeumannomyces tritici]
MAGFLEEMPPGGLLATGRGAPWLAVIVLCRTSAFLHLIDNVRPDIRMALLLAVVTAAAGVLAAPAAPNAPAAANATQPCGTAGSAWAAQKAAGVEVPSVDAALAYACLTSIPVKRSTALKTTRPRGYAYPGYDMFAELAAVRAGIEAGSYATEHAWQADLFERVFGAGHDGHMVVMPDLLDTVHWRRGLALVSVSEDGVAPPVLKAYEDVVSGAAAASAVTHIDGKDAVGFVQDWVDRAGEHQDRDANYNAMFYSKAQEVVYKTKGYFSGGGRLQLLYPGETTTLTFNNGTVVKLRNTALLQGDWTGVVDAASFVRKLTPLAVPGAQVPDTGDEDRQALARRPGVTPTVAARSALLSTRAASAWPGYPEAEAVSLDKSASGYFLSGPGYSDVAVLVLTGFSPIGFDVQAVVQKFYAKAVAAGKKKLVIDLQANEGGFIYLAYDMFRQLFPDIVQQGLGRRRLSPGFEAVARAAAAICKDFDPRAAEKVRDTDLWLLCQSPLNYGYELDTALRHFESYAQKYAPHEHHGDRFTNLTGWDLGNHADSSSLFYGFNMNVTGYGDRTNMRRPFAGPDDVVVYDGACASACTVLSEFLVHHAGVKTVSLGGRPGNCGLT